MKIAIFSDEFPVSSQTFVMNQVIGILKEGHDVDILTNRNRIDIEETIHQEVFDNNLDKKIVCLGNNRLSLSISNIFVLLASVMKILINGKFKKLQNVLSDENLNKIQKLNIINLLSVNRKQYNYEYDAIIVHFGNFGYYLCKLRDLDLIKGKVITIFHGYEISKYDVLEFNKKTYRKLFSQGDLFLPVSDLWAEKLIELGCDSRKVVTHRVGIDLENFDFSKCGEKISNPIRIIQVGRLTEKKAILNSIRAVIDYAKISSVDFKIIGDGEYYEPARKLIEDNKASSYIHLLSSQPQSIVNKHLENSDIFILPSVRASDGDMEGVPVAVMEAMAKGLIVLSTFHSGIPELINNGFSGFLVEENNIEQIVTVLHKISQLSDLALDEIRINARNTCDAHFNDKVLHKNLIGLIRNF